MRSTRTARIRTIGAGLAAMTAIALLAGCTAGAPEEEDVVEQGTAVDDDHGVPVLGRLRHGGRDVRAVAQEGLRGRSVSFRERTERFSCDERPVDGLAVRARADGAQAGHGNPRLRGASVAGRRGARHIVTTVTTVSGNFSYV